MEEEKESEGEKMKRMKPILWGLVLIALGIIWGLNAFGVITDDVFFEGWWTLFIIVPCVIGLFTDHDKTGNLIGLLIGVALLLACQGILTFDMLWKLLVPVLLVIIGLKLIFKNTFGNRTKLIADEIAAKAAPTKEYCAVFSGQRVAFDGERFEGATLTAVFGGVDFDIRRAIIEEDVVIRITTVFGGVDLYMPDNVNVKISSTGIFGGISDKRAVKTNDNAVTVYVNAVCLFGGADIK